MTILWNGFSDLRVAIWQGTPQYCQVAPYHPHVSYPEYKIGQIGEANNPAYEGIRNLLKLLNLDSQHEGLQSWNPLGCLVVPGNQVLIKPNFVVSRHSHGDNLYSIITHPSVLRAIIDYVYIALHGEGKIIIADSPQMDCNWQELLHVTQLETIQQLYWDRYRFDIDILDLRPFWLEQQVGDLAAYTKRRHPLAGDLSGDTIVSLGNQSAFHGFKNHQSLYGADYDRQKTILNHHGDIHNYCISRSALNSDVVISVPKLKVHKKVGVTLNAKGLVGITTDKNYLIHYTLGTPEEGGDQFPSGILSEKEKLLVKGQRFLFDVLLSHKYIFLDQIYGLVAKTYRTFLKPRIRITSPDRQILDGGNWYGNDSAWRMVVDLMRIAIFADRDGKLQEKPQRKFFCVIDGIVGGENDGPISPDAKEAGILLAGFHPLAVDIVATRIMGFDWKKFKWIQRMLAEGLIDSIEKIKILSLSKSLEKSLDSDDRFLDFKPHPGWRDYLS
ncbi:MAG: DUF362 domain-containing protein [Chloroflexota bacterium]